jgi:hypothetical protein
MASHRDFGYHERGAFGTNATPRVFQPLTIAGVTLTLKPAEPGSYDAYAGDRCIATGLNVQTVTIQEKPGRFVIRHLVRDTLVTDEFHYLDLYGSGSK